MALWTYDPTQGKLVPLNEANQVTYIIDKPDATTTSPTPTTTTDPYADVAGSLLKKTFIDQLGLILGFDPTNKDQQAVLEELWNIYNVKEYRGTAGFEIGLLPDLIIKNPNIAPLFHKEFQGYVDIIKNGLAENLGITSLADYNNARRSYKDLLSAYGLTDLATNENIDKFISNGVSAREAAARMDAAYTAIENADSYLLQALGDYGLKDADLAKFLLMGDEGVAQLQDKINIANIKAAELQTGLTSQLGAEDLARQGVSRAQAAQGLALTATQLEGYKAEANIQGDNAKTIQSELEKENILGLASQRRKKLQDVAVSRFKGQAGTTQGSLAKTVIGNI